MGQRIVLIDDEARLLRALKRALESDGLEVAEFLDPRQALAAVRASPPALVVSDIRMEGMSGLDLVATLRQERPEVPCILMTAYSSVETAVAAVRLGAKDYLLKPFELAEFTGAVRRALAQPAATGDEAAGDPRLVGRSPRMRAVLDLIGAVAGTDSTVLIQGESGTGKELVARLLHRRSARADRPFLPVNCSAIPETLFESELFGHQKGSFTGAVGDKPGLYQEAEGGTLFLDEIGDLAPASQAKLLRVLQDGTFKRVGDPRSTTSDVRILAATNRVLREEVEAGRFREDLWYRINVVEITLPPLRERAEDLGELVGYLLERFSRKHRRGPFTVDPALLAHLAGHAWPGNVRELENVLERAVILKRSGALHPEDVPLARGKPATVPELPPGLLPLDQTMDQIEEELIRRALATTGWNYSRAAELLGVTRQNLHYKLKKYHLRKENHG
ncbi:MAG: sigma-54-dependent Fis family transcriptional regulator [Candidatus Riflebacteria bacterium]|nr:sigma-54-dependent Fis family transcriptional regulator [Candidatus Riflebacteria bacterium]